MTRKSDDKNRRKKKKPPLAKQTESNKKVPDEQIQPTAEKSKVGKAIRARTKYIDQDTKPERTVVIVYDNGKRIEVSKVKSIKIFDENGKNADKALVEINADRYGLDKRTGVDFQVFSKNRMSGKPLDVKEKEVFPEDKERFQLGSHDLHRVLSHTGKKKKDKKKK